VVRDQDVFIIQPCSAPVNDNLMELLLYIDAFRRASAHEITAVIPYYPYGRQERMVKGREAISAKVVATILEALGSAAWFTSTCMRPATQGFFEVPVGSAHCAASAGGVISTNLSFATQPSFSRMWAERSLPASTPNIWACR